MAHLSFFSVSGEANPTRDSNRLPRLPRRKSFSRKEQKLLRELFEAADANRDGEIDYDEYAKLFSAKGLRLSKEEVRQIFRMMDKDRDMKVRPCEVFDCGSIIREKAKAAVRAYDSNRDGKVSRKEMLTVSGGRLSKAAVEKVFELNDTDGDGMLDQREMERMLAKSINAGDKNKGKSPK